MPGRGLRRNLGSRAMTKSRTLRLPGSIVEVEHSPQGPEVGAFFDLDGTLVAGFTAAVHTTERIKNKEIGLGELARMLRVAMDYRRGKVEFESFVREGVASFKGREMRALDGLGESLFHSKIA